MEIEDFDWQTPSKDEGYEPVDDKSNVFYNDDRQLRIVEHTATQEEDILPFINIDELD